MQNNFYLDEKFKSLDIKSDNVEGQDDLSKEVEDSPENSMLCLKNDYKQLYDNRNDSTEDNFQHRKSDSQGATGEKLPCSDCEFDNIPKKTSSQNYDSRTYYNNYNFISQNLSNQQCRFFKYGYCKYGDSCFYEHCNEQLCSVEQNIGATEWTKKSLNNNFPVLDQRSPMKFSPLCYYFKRGFCRNGNNCKFYHAKTFSSIENEQSNSRFSSAEMSVDKAASLNKDVEHETAILVVNEEKDMKASLTDITTISENFKTDETIVSSTLNSKNMYELSLLCESDIARLRNTEISQFKRRYPGCTEIEKNMAFTFTFEPSDPDWAFDVRSLLVQVHFPEDYPIETCEITVVHDNENIPKLLIQYLNKSISEWLNKRGNDVKKCGKVELIFRPFLKWLDKSLEELFVCGLKKVKQDMKAKEDGIEFVPFENIISSERSVESDIPFGANDTDKVDIIPEMPVESKACDIRIFNDITVGKSNISDSCMKILLTNLELIEGVATLTCTKISITIQCMRCKTSCNILSTAKKGTSQKCSKCSKDIGFTLDSSIIHQFSNVLGNLYLIDCKPVDVNLVECHFLLDCLNCSKQVAIDGIHYGQKYKTWCLFCHQKFVLSVGSIKFQASKSSLASCIVIKHTSNKVNTGKKAKDPVVKEGLPLPEFGACKHYKKSYRWLRFPCCGRIYPCDVCHDEKETDHEMKFASRMICGFCSKEQQYSRDKPCLSCSKDVTKKSGSHWEGGRGCRNKIQMSREDKQKYAGISKTISRKAQGSKSGKN